MVEDNASSRKDFSAIMQKRLLETNSLVVLGWVMFQILLRRKSAPKPSACLCCTSPSQNLLGQG